MFTHERLKPKDWKKDGPLPGTFAQPKYDGWRATLFCDRDGTVRMFGRETRPDLELLSRFPRILRLSTVEAFFETAPPISSLDGELLTDGTSTDVPSAMRDESLNLRFVPFAVPWWDGKDLEDAQLEHIAKQFSQFGIDQGVFVCNYADKTALLDQAKRLDIEGFVLKDRNYRGWWKVKEQKTCDCFVSGFEPGKGKFKGMVGSLEASLFCKDGKPVVVANVSGMDDNTRRQLSSRDLMRVFEVEYQCVASQGGLRHPRFVRWRDDKPVQECTIEQLK